MNDGMQTWQSYLIVHKLFCLLDITFTTNSPPHHHCHHDRQNGKKPSSSSPLAISWKFDLICFTLAILSMRSWLNLKLNNLHTNTSLTWISPKYHRNQHKVWRPSNILSRFNGKSPKSIQRIKTFCIISHDFLALLIQSNHAQRHPHLKRGNFEVLHNKESLTDALLRILETLKCLKTIQTTII